MGQIMPKDKETSLASIDDEEDASSPAAVLFLTASQSCSLHGWSKPKRTLSWADVRSHPQITYQACLQSGLAPLDLHSLQPDVARWVSAGKVTAEDVPSMIVWPLHPIQHLRGAQPPSTLFTFEIFIF